MYFFNAKIENLTKESLSAITMARRPPGPFESVKDIPDELEIMLKRVFGLEDIELSCVLQLVPEKFSRKAEIGKDPQARARMLQSTITIVKGSDLPTLKLRCECYSDCFAIHQADLDAEGDDTVFQP